MEEQSAKPRKRRVVVQRKVSPAEYEEFKTKMESMGLDPSKDPVPPSFTETKPGAPPRASKAASLVSDNSSAMLANLPAAAVVDTYVQPTLTASALNSQNAMTVKEAEKRIQKGQKQVSLQRRTIEEQIAHGRHDRALEKWERQQQEWENFRHHASKKTGRFKQELVVTRAEEHRERKEVMELLDRATPDEVLSGGYSWYHSLRGEGSRFITVGNMFSGLHLPVKMHKENYTHEIVRKPHLAEIASHHRGLRDGGKHTRTWRDDEYLMARIRKYGKKMQEHAPGVLETDELLEPTCIGLRPPDNFEGQDGGDREEEGQAEEVFAMDGEQLASEPLQADFADDTMLASEEVRDGPCIQALPEQLQFHTTVKKLNTQCIKLKNVGTAVIQYDWVLNEPFHAFQESILPDDPSDRFVCGSASGRVLPGCEAQTLFTFTSSIPGSYVSTWRLRTYPELREPIEDLVMHGVAVEADKLLEQRNKFQEELHDQQVLRQVQELIDDIFEDVKLNKEPLPDLSAALIQERVFEESNAALNLFWSPHSWQRLTDIGGSIGSLKAKSLKDKSVSDEASAELSRGMSKENGAPIRGRQPIKKKRGPDGASHKDFHTLNGVPSVSRLESELRQIAAPKGSALEKEKREVAVELSRSVRESRVQPLERSPLWWLAHEMVMDIAKAVPKSYASARKSCELAPVPFVPPLEEDASPEAVTEYGKQMEERNMKRGDAEKEAEAKDKVFIDDFAQNHFGPCVSKFETIAYETVALTELNQVARKTLQERLGPYAGRRNWESLDYNGNVVLYEIDLSFLSAYTYVPPAEEGMPVRRPEFHLTAEAEEQVKQRMQGIPPLLEVSPLAVVVLAHVGQPNPDPLQAEKSAPRVQMVEEGPVEVDESDLAPGLQTVPSLELISDLLRDATEGFASAVEFVPHMRWMGEAADFAAQVRADTSDNKVFLLDNMAAIPEEVGVKRFMSVHEDGEGTASERVNTLQLSWATREEWAQRVLKELNPEVYIQDSFFGARHPFTVNAGLWPSAPQKVVGQLIEGEIVAFCDALKLQFKKKGAESSAKLADGVKAPLLVVMGGGGYSKADGELVLIRKLELLLGLSQLVEFETAGVFISLGGEFCLAMLSCIFGLKLGKLDFCISDLASIAIRDALRDALALGVTITFPPDVVAVRCLPLEPEVKEEVPEPAAKGKAKAKAAPVKEEVPPEPEKQEGEEEDVEDKNVQTYSLRSAFAAMAQSPVSLGYVRGKECFTCVDAEQGTLRLQVGLPQPPPPEKPQKTPSKTAPPVEIAPTEEPPSAVVETSPLEVVPDDWAVRDIGDQACEGLRIALRRSRGVLWNGALGMLEDERFQKGTRTFLAHCGYRISGGDDDDEVGAVDEDDANEDEEDDEDGDNEDENKEEKEAEVELETSLVIGNDSARMLPTLYDTPAPFAFESKSGETLLEMLRGKSLPGLLACSEKPEKQEKRT